jgi:hypothetical protein
MTALQEPGRMSVVEVPVQAFGELAPISRAGGQGRVHLPSTVPPAWEGGPPVVVKLYRRPPPAEAADVLSAMVRWEAALDAERATWLRYLTAWPIATVTSQGRVVGIAMHDLRGRFSVPFVMPSGRRDDVLLALEHLLGGDGYLEQRGLGVRLDTAMRARVAERICAALAFLHQHAIVACDIAPSNLLVSFGGGGAAVCFIDCDSMVFHGRQALAAVQTGDWEIPPEFDEAPLHRATDAYKLGLIILRLFARSHDARGVAPHLRHVPVELRDLLYRALGSGAVNRPPAGEWQRALHGLLARGDLNDRYPGPPARPPGPAPAPVPKLPPVPSRPTAPAGPRPVVRLSPPAAYLPTTAAAARRPAAGRRAPVGPRWLRPAVVALWLVAIVAVLVLLITRLLAPATPAQGFHTTTIFYPQGPGGVIEPSVNQTP